MNDPRVCVAKIGGSLLATDDLPRRLREWLSAERAAHGRSHYVLVVGGGALVDVVRELDARCGLDQRAAHWACVELLVVTARLLATMLPDLPVEDDYQALLGRCHEPGVTIFGPNRFLHEVEPRRPGTRLGMDWTVTSDAIAARLAIVLAADELVLVKSAPQPVHVGGDLDQLAAVGYVDAFLPCLADQLPPLRMMTLDVVGRGRGTGTFCAEDSAK